MSGHKLALVLSTAVALGAAPQAFAKPARQPTPAPAPSPTPVPTPTPTPTGSATARRAAAYGELSPSWGKIRSFWGDNSPLWGDVQQYWGSTGPYANDLTPFWGKIRSFNDTDTDTVLLPSWGKIRSFAGDIGASWGKIRSFWGTLPGYDAAPSSYGDLATMIGGMVDQSRTTFGGAVQAQTGQSFDAAVRDPLFAKYGINLANPATLQSLDASTREHFFIEWYDRVMDFTGADHVDHWMQEVNWSPELTRTLGYGKDAVIGVLDFSITGAAAKNVIKYDGVSTIDNGHGTAVASLLVDPMDGKGVMGIAPNASVIAYNPFDATQTAGWTDIATGVQMLTKGGAKIINMSLGVPGWTLNGGWNDVFQSAKVKGPAAKQVFVIAAGNDGIAQTQNIVWKPDNPQFIVVGSVDPNGVISSFSNQPGTACLTDDKGKCNGDYLKNHFLVAPGELILVSDGTGGVTRMSGTSFAAPIVSGTVALIQDRWPWLADHPKDVVGVLFKSAKDLGAPGVDPIYGNGELNVLGALSPLDWTKLTIKQSVNGKVTDVKLPDLQKTTAATRATWEANSVYFSLFEDTGESYRDFEVPVSTKLDNKTVAVGTANEQFMGYLTSRFMSVIGAGFTGSGAGVSGSGFRFTDLRGATSGLPGFGDAEASLTMRPRVNHIGFRSARAPFETSFHFAGADRRFSAEFGDGESAPLVTGQAGFGLTSDYDPTSGGANPFIGFASGGAYARVGYALAPGLLVSSGFTQRTLRRDFNGIPVPYTIGLDSSPYRASAGNVALALRATPRLTTSLAYTVLSEADTVLGMGSTSPIAPHGGSSTDAATLGIDWAVTPTLSLSGAATAGRTRAGDRAQEAFAVGRGGIVASAFQVAVAKSRVLGGGDHLRLSLAQPMHVEAGSIDISTVQVVDRDTGALGVVTQTADLLKPQRRYVAELIYGRPLLAGLGEVDLFGRANLRTSTADELPGVVAGTSVRVAF